MVWTRDLQSNRHWTHGRTGTRSSGRRWRFGRHQEPGKVTETILLVLCIKILPAVTNFTRCIHCIIIEWAVCVYMYLFLLHQAVYYSVALYTAMIRFNFWALLGSYEDIHDNNTSTLQ